jgi:hypothetical protein
MLKGIRSYGPGKFDTIIDGYVYDFAIDGGVDEEESYPEGGGWYGLVMLDDSAREAIRQAVHYTDDELTEEEEDLLDDSEAIILFERSDGIVEADWFSSRKEALDEWAGIQEEFEEEGEED